MALPAWANAAAQASEQTKRGPEGLGHCPHTARPQYEQMPMASKLWVEHFMIDPQYANPGF
jgi:hypothetical protein